MKKCGYAKKFRGTRVPKCDKGQGCDACWEKWQAKHPDLGLWPGSSTAAGMVNIERRGQPYHYGPNPPAPSIKVGELKAGEKLFGFDYFRNPFLGDSIFMLSPGMRPRTGFNFKPDIYTAANYKTQIHSGLTVDKLKVMMETMDDIMHPKPLREYTSAERKEMPVQTVMAEYFPDAFAALARHSKKANDKHNPGEPMHWARKKSTDHLNCAGRHLLTPDSKDPDTGEIEAVCLLWRAAAYVQLFEEKRLVKAGIKPLSGVVE